MATVMADMGFATTFSFEIAASSGASSE